MHNFLFTYIAAESSSSEESEDEAPPPPKAKKRKADQSAEVVSEKKGKKDNKRKADDAADVGETPAKQVKSDGEPCSVFVGSLSWNTTDETLKAFCDENGINTTGCRVVMDRESGRSRGFGYCDFTSSDEAKKLLDLTGSELDGREIRCDMSSGTPGGGRGGNRGGRGRGTPRGRGGRGGTPGSGQQYDNETPTKLLMVKNLSYDTDNDSLAAAFPGANDARVVYDRETQKPRGFAFVEFDDVEQAKKARSKMLGKDLDGRNINVVFATPKSDFQGGRGGRGGGGFRGGSGGRGSGGRGGRGGGRGRGAPRGGFKAAAANKGAIQNFEGSKLTFNDDDSD